jgi:anhydro-N-acetylmuramic acid kinase
LSTQRFIGLMSGTSLDGVDGVLCEFDDAHPSTPSAASTSARTQVLTLAHVALPFESEFKQALLALNSPGDNELHRAALAANQLARAYAEVVRQLLTLTGSSAEQITAIGAHGQTVRHQPQVHDGTGYTLQLNNPALIAELTGIAVVADFRSRDVAAGGQGAPLVPAFHAEVFGKPNEATAVLNIGGIANLTLLGDGVLGFDTGPGNALMDHWCQLHTGAAFDRDGAWAASGEILAPLLQALQKEPFFQQAPPKSTGRDLFNARWLGAKLAPFAEQAMASNLLRPQDVQATLTELTAWSSARALRDSIRNCTHLDTSSAASPSTSRAGSADTMNAKPRRLLVCGGGALNKALMRRLQTHLPDIEVASSAAEGIPPLQVEAVAFAWLARQTWLGRTSNLPAVTGARGPRVLGAIYPASVI